MLLIPDEHMFQGLGERPGSMSERRGQRSVFCLSSPPHHPILEVGWVRPYRCSAPWDQASEQVMWRRWIVRMSFKMDSGGGWGLKWTRWYVIHVILSEDGKTSGDHWSVVLGVCQEICSFQQLDGGSYGGPAGHVHSAHCWRGPGRFTLRSSVAGWPLEQKAT